MSLRKWRLGAGLFSVFGLVVGIIGGGVLLAPVALAVGQPQVICHRTNSDANPYVVNPPDIASIVKDEGHGAHTGPIWVPGLKDAKIDWGDIIPAFDYETGIPGDKHGGHYPGMNWSAYGQAIYNNGCSVPVPGAVISTTVFDASTNGAWSGTEQAGASAYDTSLLTYLAGGPVPTGTVTYAFFTNSNCSGGSNAGTVSVGAGGSVPRSDTKSNLAAGFYAFQATYSGDVVYKGSKSSCENFSVKSAPGGPKATVTTTTVFNAATNAAWSGAVAPASAYDTAKVVTPSAIPAPTGTVTYTFFNNGTCAGDGTSAGTKTIGLMGSVPNSDTKSGLTAGSYSFMAKFSSSDATKFNDSESVCEPFTVSAPGDPRTTTTTTIFNGSTNTALSGALALNGSVYDTSNVTHVGGLTPTGTISYTFFSNGTCSGTGVAAGTGLPLGSKSTTQGPLAAGSYSFMAKFTSSDTKNFNDSQSGCEPFTVVGGGVLAQTGANPPGLGIALSLLILGLFAIGGALLVLRRSEA